MRTNNLTWLGLCFLLFVAFLNAEAQSRMIQNKSRPASQICPDFPYDIPLKTLNGDTVLSSEALNNNGRPMVLAFWLTTCLPCRIEMKNIAPYYEDWIEETGVRIAFISTDFEHNAHKIAKFIKEEGYPFEVYHDMHREFRQMLPGGLNGLPQSFLISAEGEILYHKRKYSSGDEFRLYEAMKTSVN
jgi:thiol-disulfide isomerase/thioredoxin